MTLANRVVVSEHAWQRMGERGVTAADLRHGCAAARAAEQPNGRWRLGTSDHDGEAFSVVVELGPPVVVVTLFG